MQFFKTLFIMLLVSITYIILGKLSILYITMPEGIAIVWLPNAVILSVFLLRPKSEWIWYIFTFFISELIADSGSFTLIQASQFACINICEGLISVWLIKKFNKNSINFQNTKYIISFILIALTIVPSIAALFGSLVYITQIGTQSSFIDLWRIWFFGDALGLLLLVPFIVLSIENRKLYFGKILNLENIIIGFLTIFLAISIFSTTLELVILPSTPMIFLVIFMWLTYRSGIILSMSLAIIIISIAVYFTVNLEGPFSLFSPKLNTLYLQEFISTLVLLILFFGILLREIKEKNFLLLQSNEKLEKLSKELENRVTEKTKSLEIANKKLKLLSTIDPLTQIYNRRFFEESIKNEIEKAKRYGTNLSFILLDIDFFKTVNDRFGHQIGDEVLISFSKLIKDNIRKIDIFSRIGGEEFAIILPHTKIDEANALALKLKDVVENNILLKEGFEIKFTVSMGISSLNLINQTYSDIFKAADENLYKAKDLGRNMVIS